MHYVEAFLNTIPRLRHGLVLIQIEKETAMTYMCIIMN